MKTIALLVEVALLLVLLEVGIRTVVSPQVDVPHIEVSARGFYTWYPGSRFTYHNLPNVQPPQAEIRINEHGLRGEPLPVAKQPDETRILVLGDSYTAAVQLPEEVIFTSLLDRQLNGGATDRHYRVVNAGFNGAGTAHELLYFLERGRDLAPDILVLQYSFNDLVDNLTHGGFRWRDGGLELAEDLRNPGFWRQPLLAVRDWLGNRSLAFYLLCASARAAVQSVGRHMGRAPIPDAEAAPGVAGGSESGSEESVTAQPAIELLHHVIDRLIASANSMGIPVVIVTIPSPLYLSGGDPTWAQIHARLRTMVSGTENQLIVTDRMFAEAEKRGRPVYLAHDGHLSEEGHRLVAAELARAVRHAEEILLDEGHARHVEMRHPVPGHELLQHAAPVFTTFTVPFPPRRCCGRADSSTPDGAPAR